MTRSDAVGDAKVFLSPEFVKGFKRATSKHRSFPDDFDNFLAALRIGRARYVAPVPNLPKGCDGFVVSKVRHFRCADLNKGSQKGYRIIFSVHGDSVLFLECYMKSDKGDMDRVRVCDAIAMVKDGSCKGRFTELTVPKSRAIVRQSRVPRLTWRAPPPGGRCPSR